MAHHLHLKNVLVTLTKRLRENERLSNAGNRWLARPLTRTPRFTVRHRDYLAEIAFLKAYIAWELFLEESFVLFLLGKLAPAGARPIRTIVPSTRAIAEKLFIPETRPFADWTVTEHVLTRAKKSFKTGTDPYSLSLRRHNNTLTEIKKIRNAIAHSSSTTQELFKQVARDRLRPGVCPPDLTVGGFLSMTDPATVALDPESFFEGYLGVLKLAAEGIVPA